MNNNVGTNEVQYYAFKKIKHMNTKSLAVKFNRQIHDNMNYKLNDALENEKEAKENMTQTHHG